MKTKLALLAAAGSLALMNGAFAQDMEGYYGTIGAGVVLENDTNDLESGDAFPAAFDTDLDLDSNIALSGALGRYFANGWRGELELATRTQDVDALAGDGLGFAGFPSSTALGEVTATTLMVNAIKDFHIDAAGRLNPYLGAGFGAARIRSEYDNISDGVFATTAADMATSNVISVEDTAFVPALQGLAGLTFDFTDNMMFSVGYRYLVTSEYKHDAYLNGPEASVSGEYEAHEIMAGLRWNFSAPVAAPVEPPVTLKTCFDGSRIPVTQDCPVEPEVDTDVEIDPLVVYFDYDKATLTPASNSLIDAKVSEVMEAGSPSAVTVSGNTDTTGSSAYNQALSARRAAVVKSALEGRGIDASVISVEALGESNPAPGAKLGDGVKEPLNRRTEVDFEF